MWEKVRKWWVIQRKKWADTIIRGRCSGGKRESKTWNGKKRRKMEGDGRGSEALG